MELRRVLFRSQSIFQIKSMVRRFFWMATQVKDQLMASHEEFRRLAQEHSQYSQRLDSLIQKRYLSEEEKLEEVRLKKLKLRIKDQMELLEHTYRQQHEHIVA